MAKIWAIAVREYRAMVGTKAFVLSIAIMTILMFGGIIAVDLLKQFNPDVRRIAIIDSTGLLFEPLQAAAQAQRRERAPQDATDEEKFAGPNPVYELEKLDVQVVSDELRSELSDRIRRQ